MGFVIKAAELYLRPVSSVLAVFTDTFLFLFLCLMVSPGRITGWMKDYGLWFWVENQETLRLVLSSVIVEALWWKPLCPIPFVLFFLTSKVKACLEAILHTQHNKRKFFMKDRTAPVSSRTDWWPRRRKYIRKIIQSKEKPTGPRGC